MSRVITYIDGYNLYHGMKSAHGRKYLWLNLEAMSESILSPTDDLLVTKYFTSRVTHEPHTEKRQRTYIDALMQHTNVEIHFGRFQVLKNETVCKFCGNSSDLMSEKMTDVQIATHLITDSFTDKFDIAIIITGDTDIIPAIQSVKKYHANKRIGIYFPPNRHSKELQRQADFWGVVGEIKLRDNQLPTKIIKDDGYVLNKPPNWV